MTALTLERNSLFFDTIQAQLEKARAIKNHVSAHKQDIARNIKASIREALPSVTLGAFTRIAVRAGLEDAAKAAAFPATFLAGTVGTGVSTVVREERRVREHGLSGLYGTYVKEQKTEEHTEHGHARRALGAVGNVAKELAYGQQLEGKAVERAFRKDERFDRVHELSEYVAEQSDPSHIVEDYIAQYGPEQAQRELRQDLTDVLMARIMKLEHGVDRKDQKTRAVFNKLSAALSLLPDAKDTSILADIHQEQKTTKRKAIAGITAARIAKLGPRMLAGALFTEAIAGIAGRAQTVKDVVRDSVQGTYEDDAAQFSHLTAQHTAQKALFAPRYDTSQNPIRSSNVVTDTQTGCVTTKGSVLKKGIMLSTSTTVCPTPTAGLNGIVEPVVVTSTPSPTAKTGEVCVSVLKKGIMVKKCSTPIPTLEPTIESTPIPAATPTEVVPDVVALATPGSAATQLDIPVKPAYLPIMYKGMGPTIKAPLISHEVVASATPTPIPTTSAQVFEPTPVVLATEVPTPTPVPPVIHFDYQHPITDTSVTFETSVAGMPNFVSDKGVNITSIPMPIKGFIPFGGVGVNDELLANPPDGVVMQYGGLDLNGAEGETVGIYTCAKEGTMRTLIKFVSVDTTDLSIADDTPTVLIAHADGNYHGSVWNYQPFERFRYAVSKLFGSTKGAKDNEWIDAPADWKIFLTSPDGKLLAYKAVKAMIVDDAGPKDVEAARLALQ